MAFGFGFDFCSVELRKYVDSGWLRVASGGCVGSAEVKD